MIMMNSRQIASLTNIYLTEVIPGAPRIPKPMTKKVTIVDAITKVFNCTILEKGASLIKRTITNQNQTHQPKLKAISKKVKSFTTVKFS